jgi:hypothetical protein
LVELFNQQLLTPFPVFSRQEEDVNESEPKHSQEQAKERSIFILFYILFKAKNIVAPWIDDSTKAFN